jgi:hypothetical protein
MKTVADECWRIAAECEHWAEESQDDATRIAFRQMAKAWAKLAFGEEFGPTEGSMDSEDLDEATPSPKHTPPSPSLETPLAEHEEEDLESDVDAEGDAEDRAPTQRLSLPSRAPFPKR